MSSTTRPAAAARRRVAWQQATLAKRRRQRLAAIVGITLVIALFAALVIAKAADTHSTTPTASATSPAASSLASPATTAHVVAQATSVPASIYAAIGTGGTAAQAQAITGAGTLTVGGKPQVLYLGAEYCPYCAAERWPLVLALSRFGTFTGLELTESSSSDVYPDTNTFTFLHATYTSTYLAFTPVELYDRNDNPLQSATAAQQQLLQNYGQGGIPFIDLGGTAMLRSSGYSPQLLAGMSWTQIAASLTDTTSPAARAIVGTAERITGQLCRLTGNRPATVCQTSEISSLEGTS